MAIQLSDHFTFSKLLRFTLPSIGMTVFTSIYSVVDGLFVSNCVGSEAIAAINLIYPVIMILGSCGFMIGTGGSALVAKMLGEKKEKEARGIFSFLIVVMLMVGIVFSLIGIIITRSVSAFMGADGSLLDQCVVYGRISFIGLTALMLQFCFQSFLITAERPRLGLFVTVGAGLTNIVLDALFVAVLHFGVAGAAWATITSQFFGALIPLAVFFRKDRKLYFVKPLADLRQLLKAAVNGASEFLSNISASLVSIVFNYQLMRIVGEDGVAAYGVIMYVCFIFMSVFFGYGMGVCPVISFHYGANNHSELKNLFRKSYITITVMSAAMLLASELLAKTLSALYVGYDAELLAMTTRGFRIYATSFGLCGFGVFTSSFFTALNNGLISGVISVLRILVLQIASVLILPAILGLDGIWLSVTVAEFFAVIMCLYFIRRFGKKYQYL